MMRDIGPRQLSDIPRSEVAELIKNLDLGGSPADVIKRAVLNAYGLIRLTAMRRSTAPGTLAGSCQAWLWLVDCLPLMAGGGLGSRPSGAAGPGYRDAHIAAARTKI